MMLYVDETENSELFIVTGLLVKSEVEINNAYYSFKNQINKLKIQKRYKSKLYIEFKSTTLDSRFQRIKIKMLESLNKIDNTVIYSVYFKKSRHMKQSVKDKIYIRLLSSIIDCIDENDQLNVVFDEIPNKQTINSVIKTISKRRNVISIISSDSQLIPGLQYVDNLCSVIRISRCGNDQYGFYKIIKKNTIEASRLNNE